MGGIGKTQLACEFAYRYGQYFAGGVFWLGCADPAAIPAEIATCGRGLNLHPDFTGLPLDGQVALVAAAWHSELPRLLIFDNCEDEAVLEDWVPRGGGCRVLVTARRGTWRPELGVQAIALGILTRSRERGAAAPAPAGSGGGRPGCWTRSRPSWATCRWRCTSPAPTWGRVGVSAGLYVKQVAWRP